MNRKVTEAELNIIKAIDSQDETGQDSTASFSLLKLLSSLDRDLVRKMMSECRYDRGEVIFAEGDDGDALYVIWSGRLAVVKGKFYQPDEVFFRVPGEVVGDMALLENKPRWASLIALEPSRLLRIEREGFYKLLETPAISLHLLALLSGRLRMIHDNNRVEIRNDQQLLREISTIKDENEQLQMLQRIRQEATDLIVHDLRSPLGNMFSVLNMLELVLPEEVLEANRQLLEIAQLVHGRMQDLVDSLLDVSKLESGDLLLDLGPASLRELAQGVVEMAAFSIEQRSIVFETDFDANLPLVMMDEDRIRRVLTNLVENAVKFTPQDGRVVVSIRTKEDWVEVWVTDSGPGIPVADRQRIFERFAQAPRIGMRRTRGFGLGLAFCRLAVQAHGGKIWVETGENGSGSRFIFTLPVAQVE